MIQFHASDEKILITHIYRGKFVHKMTLFRDISLRWGTVFMLPEKKTTEFFVLQKLLSGDYLFGYASYDNNNALQTSKKLISCYIYKCI